MLLRKIHNIGYIALHQSHGQTSKGFDYILLSYKKFSRQLRGVVLTKTGVVFHSNALFNFLGKKIHSRYRIGWSTLL
jgi:hypothetical protein